MCQMPPHQCTLRERGSRPTRGAPTIELVEHPHSVLHPVDGPAGLKLPHGPMSKTLYGKPPNGCRILL